MSAPEGHPWYGTFGRTGVKTVIQGGMWLQAPALGYVVSLEALTRALDEMNAGLDDAARRDRFFQWTPKPNGLVARQ